MTADRPAPPPPPPPINWIAEANQAYKKYEQGVLDPRTGEAQDHGPTTLLMFESFGDRTQGILSEPAFVVGYVSALVEAKEAALSPTFHCGRAVPSDRDEFMVTDGGRLAMAIQMNINAVVDVYAMYRELA